MGLLRRRREQRQQQLLQQEQAERQQKIQNRRQVCQTRAEQHEQARLSHERIKRQQYTAAYQEKLRQQHSRQYQQVHVDHGQRVKSKGNPVVNVDTFKEQQANGAYEDHDSDMLVTEDEETGIHASPVKLASAVDGYVDTRGVFREY